MDTERVYVQKCKTEAVERTLQNDRYLLSSQNLNEFMSNNNQDYDLLNLRKIKRQMNNLEKIQVKINKKMQ